MKLPGLAAPLCLLLVSPPALANDPDPDDAAQSGQLAPDPDAPRDFALPAHDAAATKCWMRANRRRGAPSTRVTATYRVAANGRVRGARVFEPAKAAPAAKRCVLAALRTNRFPPDDVMRVLGDSPDEREVRHTFALPHVDAPIRNVAVARLLGVLSAPDGQRIADLLTGLPADAQGLGGIGTIQGAGGLGIRGTGVGGGGQGVVGSGSLAAPRGTVHTADPTVRGTLAPAVVRRVVQASLGRYRACYDRTLRSDPTVGGRLDAEVVISALGGVAEVRLGDQGPADTTLRQCVQGSLRTLRFPTPEGGGVVVASFPLTFTP